MRHKDYFEQLVDAMGKSADITLKYWFQKQKSLFEGVERRRLVEEVKREVLDSLSVEVDITNAIQEIERLNAEIDKLRR